MKAVAILGAISNTAKPEADSARRKQVKALVEAGIADAFKAACAKASVSMAGELSRFMSDYCKAAIKRKPSAGDMSTRRNRRKQVSSIIKQMERIRVAEKRYYDNFPENLRTSTPYEATEEAISVMGEAIDSLGAIYG